MPVTSVVLVPHRTFNPQEVDNEYTVSGALGQPHFRIVMRRRCMGAELLLVWQMHGKAAASFRRWCSTSKPLQTPRSRSKTAMRGLG
eukprot:SAG31_NODE_2415_length_5732_cov_7.567016_9_plen_87_part_00